MIEEPGAIAMWPLPIMAILSSISRESAFSQILSTPCISSGRYFDINFDEHFWRSEENKENLELDERNGGRIRKVITNFGFGNNFLSLNFIGLRFKIFEPYSKSSSSTIQRGDLSISIRSLRFKLATLFSTKILNEILPKF